MSDKTIFGKFLAAQTELQNVAKDQKAKAGQATYRYADISDVLSMVRPILNKHGLCLMQRAESTEHTVTIETFLYDADGNEIRSGGFTVSTTGLMQKGVQAHGSAVTYARRYSLVTFLGVAYGDDDDGQQAVKHHQAPAPKPAKPKTDAGFDHLTKADLDEIKSIAVNGTEAFKQWTADLQTKDVAKYQEFRRSQYGKALWDAALQADQHMEI